MMLFALLLQADEPGCTRVALDAEGGSPRGAGHRAAAGGGPPTLTSRPAVTVRSEEAQWRSRLGLALGAVVVGGRLARAGGDQLHHPVTRVAGAAASPTRTFRASRRASTDSEPSDRATGVGEGQNARRWIASRKPESRERLTGSAGPNSAQGRPAGYPGRAARAGRREQDRQPRPIAVRSVLRDAVLRREALGAAEDRGGDRG